MIIHTEGVILQRSPLREKDENLLFFTKKCGKTPCVSFGSKSPRSQRAKHLASLNWLSLDIEHRTNQYRLCSATSLRPLLYSTDPHEPKDILFLKQMLQLFHQKLPFLHADSCLYNLLRLVTSRELSTTSISFRQFVFYYSYLHLSGVFPMMTNDVLSQTKANNLYVYHAQNKRYVLNSSKETQQPKQISLPALSRKSLEVLCFFGEHYSNTHSFYRLTHQVIFGKNQSNKVEIEALVTMGKQLSEGT